MAYAADVVEERTLEPGGRVRIVLRISETDVGASDEWSWGDAAGEDLPREGTIMSFQAELVSGTGATIAPRLGKASGWSDNTTNEITQSPGTPAAAIHDISKIRYTAKEGTRAAIYGSSVANAGADNVVETTIVIVSGHVS